MDSIQTGAWTGTLAYGGAAAPLASATFIGERVGHRQTPETAVEGSRQEGAVA